MIRTAQLVYTGSRIPFSQYFQSLGVTDFTFTHVTRFESGKIILFLLSRGCFVWEVYRAPQITPSRIWIRMGLPDGLRSDNCPYNVDVYLPERGLDVFVFDDFLVPLSTPKIV